MSWGYFIIPYNSGGFCSVFFCLVSGGCPPHPPWLWECCNSGSQAGISGDSSFFFRACCSTGHTRPVSLTKDPVVPVGFACFFFVFSFFFFCFSTVTEPPGLASFTAVLLGSSELVRALPGPRSALSFPLGAAAQHPPYLCCSQVCATLHPSALLASRACPSQLRSFCCLLLATSG